MKKIIALLIVGFLFFSGNSLFADAYDDCFEIERLKAKSDGLGAVEAAELASKFCRAKLGGTQSQTSQNSAIKSNTQKREGVFVSAVPVFSGQSISYKNKLTQSEDTVYRSDVNSPESTSTETGAEVRNESTVIRGNGLKVGYQFQNFRVAYSRFQWEFTDIFLNLTGNLVIADFLAESGFFVGAGIGRGEVSIPRSAVPNIPTISNSGTSYTTKYTISSEDEDILLFNVGYDYGLNEKLQLSLGVLYTQFNPTITTIDNYGYDYSDGGYNYYNTTRKSEVESSFATIFLTFNVLF